MPRTGEQVVNALLARALRARNPRWREHTSAERTGILRGQPGKRPDIVISPPGSQTVIIETEFVPASTVEQDAIERLGEEVIEGSSGSIEHTVAVRLPAALQSMVQSQGDALLEAVEYEYCVFTDLSPYMIGDERSRWPSAGWLTGSIDSLAECIDHLMVSQRLIDESVDTLEQGVARATALIQGDVALGYPDTPRNLGIILNQKPSEQTLRMAMMIIANAMTFHTMLAGTYDIPSIHKLLEGHVGRGSPISTAIFEAWNKILTEINYWPIFHVARQLLLEVPLRIFYRLICVLDASTARLSELGVSTRHDVCGRLFQSLIADRKFIATFYTRPSSATLLSELAVSWMRRDWKDLEGYANLRIADLSCGTGTLLSAAYRAILSRYRLAGGDDSRIHGMMMEECVVAADIMPAAAHLCASQLSGAHPTVTFNRTRVYTMPYGRPDPEEAAHAGIAIGSLDLLDTAKLFSLFSTGRKRVEARSAETDELAIDLPHNSLDLVIMNPPFTRPTNHESTTVPVPSFAGFQTSSEEQSAMSLRLKELRTGLLTPAGHGNAGLASYFLDLAHVKIKLGGMLAFVIPLTILRGRSWAHSRELLVNHYTDIVFVSIAAYGDKDRAFSSDTGMAEVLLIARRAAEQSECTDEALYINLFSQPDSILEAAVLAETCARISSEAPYGTLRIGEGVEGGFIRGSVLTEGGCGGVREVHLPVLMRKLRAGVLALPRSTVEYSLPITRLHEVGDRGLVDRDINGGKDKKGQYRGPFTIEQIRGIPSYPVLWAHAADAERKLFVAPDRQASVRPGYEDQAKQVWQTATRLHYNRGFRINSQSLSACLTNEPVLGGPAWPNFRCHESAWEAVLLLWANTTLGLMSFWWEGSRQQQGRAIMTISTLPRLLTMDPRQLRKDQIACAQQILDQFAERTFLPANEAHHDETRHALDRAVLIELLELPESVLEPLHNVRLQWCAEPSVHGGKGTRPKM